MLRWFPRMLAIAFILAAWAFFGCQSSTPSHPVATLDSTSHYQSIQPDYSRWKQVQPGMTEAQVEALLGKPLERTDPQAPIVTLPTGEVIERVNSYIATYGRIQFDDVQSPQPYEFYILYHSATAAVAEKSDPFGGDFSPNGMPATPHLILPFANQSFDHYPRFLDLRWQPSSGLYPITYEIEFTFADGGAWTDPSYCIHHESNAPYLLETWIGANPGWWRVRAKNAMGVSPWSETRSFKFSR